MAESKKPSFKELMKETIHVPPTGPVLPPHLSDDEDEESDISKLPALFATIHYKSDARPNGYSSEDIADMNRRANKHLNLDSDETRQLRADLHNPNLEGDWDI